MAGGRVPYHDLPEYEITRSYEALRFLEGYPVNRDERFWTTVLPRLAGKAMESGCELRQRGSSGEFGYGMTA
jgi:hypothetical protein